MNERIQELLEQSLRWSGENVNRNLYSVYEIQQKEYERFAELIRADEREACEEAVDAISRKYRQQHYADAENIADECVAAIRARGKK